MKLLGGKVEVRTLREVDPGAPRSEVQVRIKAAGGELAVLSDNVVPASYLACVELRANIPRGNHFHKKRNESFYLIAGEAVLYLKDERSGERAQADLRTGDLVFIEPMVAHVFVPVSNGHAVEFSKEPFEASDVYRVEPLV